MTGDAAAQVSPGPLARPHAKLEGIAHCLDCHAGKSTGMDERCLACHRPIAALREAGRGYHAREGKAACAKCHPDHAGIDFALIDWPKGGPPGFDHAASAGWRLEGKHATVACRDCHSAKHRTGSFSADSWLGLEPACASCHADPHKGSLGPDCAHCHSTKGWKDVSVFDHAKTAFPLTGKHGAVKCEGCHRPPGFAQTVLKPIPHAECGDCHKDPHAGRFGPKCAACHTTAAFAAIVAGAFDHERTRYPLRGAHREVRCAACHVPGRSDEKRPQFVTCGGCHADRHAGQGTLAGARVDCAACHDVAGFKVVVFTAARHATTPFPLEGKHATVPCGKCHHPSSAPDPKLGTAGVAMRPRHDACATCHADPHGGQLATRQDKGACEPCHTAAGWVPSRFGAKEHARLALTLEGAHGRAPCAACHGVNRKGLPPPMAAARAGRAAFVFTGIESDCVGCHRDPHGFQDGSCARCHGASAWRPSGVDATAHARYAFPLDGAHRAVGCAECHKELQSRPQKASSLILGTGTLPALPFRDTRRACADCHASPHGDQFASRNDGGRCESCHGIETFKPATRFEHDRDTAFVLGRAHTSVPCVRCHLPKGDASGAPRIIYRGVDKRCEACHNSRTLSGARS